jgi:hypothetical protein
MNYFKLSTWTKDEVFWNILVLLITAILLGWMVIFECA